MEDFIKIENQIFELSFTNFLSIDSKLITKQEDLNLLKKWLSPLHQDFQLRLLYRGTRDGLTYEAFHKKCDHHETTLTIAKSNYGKVFGGYSDKPWKKKKNYTQSQDTWLFSIDEKLKFPIMETGYIHAIYSSENYGPTFGSGHDLKICLPGKYKGEYSNNQSYSYLGNTYQMVHSNKKKIDIYSEGQTEAQTILAGSSQFNVEELEIYVVEKRGKSGPLEFDSKIINPKQDLDLIKSWLGGGKNHKFELIYRGSRDGFAAEDFHQACDGQGPTLVVCKSNFEKVFGGFTSKDWSNDDVYVEDPEAFLFSLSKKTKHPITGKNYALYCSESYGPIFGTGYDLCICSESNISEGSNSSLGTSYQVSESVGQKKSYLAGYASFLLDEIEVFTVESSGLL